VLLQQELTKALAASPGFNRPIAVMVIDLERFDDINNTFGHEIGDSLLKQVGVRLREELHDGEMVAYIGASKFVVVLTDAAAYNTTAKIRQLLNALTAPCPVSGLTYELGVLVGVALAPGHGTDPGTLLRKAHVALHQARQSGLSHVLYHASEDPYKPQRLALLGDFRRAVKAGELQLYCQPKADIVSGEIIGAEALVRWLHPERGLIVPDQFVPLIEPTDLIHLLTRFMLQAAISQCYSWKQQGFHVPLAVNLSARNLMEPDLAANLNYFLLAWGADPDWLGLELTESSLMKDPTASIAELERLSKMGFRLFIDDFGTGYSSLNYLMKLPVHVIKIDHGFTMRMTEDKGAAAIVKSTIELAHSLDMSVVAEGTSTRAVWDALSTLGCDEAQGHFIAPPMPARDFMPWLQASHFRLRGSDRFLAH
jgi:diguanylate cyclase (GGDEF)-like protein